MKIGIFQPFLDDKTKQLILAPAIAYDFTANPDPGSREILIYRKIMSEGLHRDFDVSGLFSYKFTDKSGVTPAELKDWVSSQPKHDVYLVNWIIPETLFNYNIWTCGERSHPGLLDLARVLFKKFDLGIDPLEIPWNYTGTCASNFWLATPEFWEEYFAFLNPMHDYMRRTPEFNRRARYRIDPTISFIPFINERLLTTYLFLNRERVRFTSYQFSDAQRAKILKHAFISLETYEATKQELEKLIQSKESRYQGAELREHHRRIIDAFYRSVSPLDRMTDHPLVELIRKVPALYRFFRMIYLSFGSKVLLARLRSSIRRIHPLVKTAEK
jgi:hypothetical protein